MSNGIELLRAMVCALSDWSAAAKCAAQQQQHQLPGNKRQPADLTDAVSELHERSKWLPAAAGSLLHLMREHPLCAQVDDKRQLLVTLGQLLQEVLSFDYVFPDSCKCTCFCMSFMKPAFTSLHVRST